MLFAIRLLSGVASIYGGEMKRILKQAKE